MGDECWTGKRPGNACASTGVTKLRCNHAVSTMHCSATTAAPPSSLLGVELTRSGAVRTKCSPLQLSGASIDQLHRHIMCGMRHSLDTTAGPHTHATWLSSQ